MYSEFEVWTRELRQTVATFIDRVLHFPAIMRSVLYHAWSELFMAAICFVICLIRSENVYFKSLNNDLMQLEFHKKYIIYRFLFPPSKLRSLWIFLIFSLAIRKLLYCYPDYGVTMFRSRARQSFLKASPALKERQENFISRVAVVVRKISRRDAKVDCK